MFQFPSNGIVVPNTIEKMFDDVIDNKFRFPSNGIVVPNAKWFEQDSPELSVSIPFKRDSSSERSWKRNAFDRISVSIPFKRDSSSEQANTDLDLIEAALVSIPFKRDSSSELRQ